MKKLILILLCVPLMFSCGEKNEEKDIKIQALEKRIEELELNGGGRYQSEIIIEKRRTSRGNPFDKDDGYLVTVTYITDTKTGEVTKEEYLNSNSKKIVGYSEGFPITEEVE